jgi:Fic family protein
VYSPRFSISPSLLELVAKATELRAFVGQTLVDVAWLPALQMEASARSVHSSTAIEGNTLTLPEVTAIARGETIGGSGNAIQEVRDGLAAVRWIMAREPGHPIRERDVLDLHKLLTAGTLPATEVGAYKTRQNRVVDGRGHLLYLPPAPGQTPTLMKDLLEWLAGSESSALHPIVVSAIAHHRLVSIHPFSDGNGRVARALGMLVLYARGFDTHHILAVDEIFAENRPRYYDKVQQARDLDDDLSLWIEYVGDAVVQALARARSRIESLRLHSRHSLVLSKRQEDFVRFLRDRGRVRTAELAQAFGLTRARLGQILGPLIEADLVVREGKTRATSYRLKDL